MVRLLWSGRRKRKGSQAGNNTHQTPLANFQLIHNNPDKQLSRKKKNLIKDAAATDHEHANKSSPFLFGRRPMQVLWWTLRVTRHSSHHQHTLTEMLTALLPFIFFVFSHSLALIRSYWWPQVQKGGHGGRPSNSSIVGRRLRRDHEWPKWQQWQLWWFWEEFIATTYHAMIRNNMHQQAEKALGIGWVGSAVDTQGGWLERSSRKYVLCNNIKQLSSLFTFWPAFSGSLYLYFSWEIS